MSLWESILFGIIQGLTEFLPVSSSGHLALIQALFNTDCGESSQSFSVLLHLGTLIAVFIVYAKDIWELICSFFSLCSKLIKGKRKMSDFTVMERMVIFVIVATIPLVPAALLEDRIAALSGYTWAVGIILVANIVLVRVNNQVVKVAVK